MNLISRLRASARFRLTLAGALFVGTVVAGLATQGGAVLSMQNGTPDVSPLRFRAPGAGPVTFSGKLDRGAVMRGDDGTLRMELVLGADAAAPNAKRLPTDLVVVLDRSGSMAGEKMDFAKAAILAMLEQVGSADRFALVSYSDHARIDIPLGAPTSIGRWREVVAAIAPVGATHLSHGIDLGLQTSAPGDGSGRATRLVLISDGLANRGDASLDGLRARARSAAMRETPFSTVGVGEDFNEGLMTALADAGTGNYYFLESARNLAAVFVSEFEAARNTIASGLEISIDPGPGVEVIEAAGYPIERDGTRSIVRPGALFAGQERRLWITLRAPNQRAGEYSLGDFRLAYTEGRARRELSFATQPVIACVEERERFIEKIDRAIWESGVASDGYAALQQRVSGLVKDGRKKEAEAEIEGFVDENRVLNASLQSDVVEEQIGRASQLRRDVDDAFTGADADAKRNYFSKSRGLSSQMLRRNGAYRVDPEALMKGETR